MNLKKLLIKHFSKIRFVLISLAFILLAIVTLIASRGNTITPQGIIQTGSIKLNIKPEQGITVYLNEQKQTLSSSLALESVAPGNYLLRIDKQDYLSWEQEVKVQPGIVTNLSIQLIPNKLNAETVSNKNVSDFKYVSADRLFYIVNESQIGNDLGIWQSQVIKPSFAIIPENESKILNLNFDINTAISKQEFTLTPSPDNQKVLVKVSNDYYVINASTENQLDESNKIILDFLPTNVSWLQGSNTLLIQDSNLLMEYELSTKQKQVIFYGATLPAYTISNGLVLYIHNSQLYIYGNRLSVKQELIGVSIPSNINKIVAVSSENIWMQTDSEIFFLNTKYSFLSEIGKGSFLFTSGSGLNALVNDEQAEISYVKVTISEVNRSVSISKTPTALPKDININSVSWAANDSYFIYKLQSTNDYFISDNRGQNITNLNLESEQQIISAQVLSNNELIVLAKSVSVTNLEEVTRSSLIKLKLN